MVKRRGTRDVKQELSCGLRESTTGGLSTAIKTSTTGLICIKDRNGLRFWSVQSSQLGLALVATSISTSTHPPNIAQLQQCSSHYDRDNHRGEASKAHPHLPINLRPPHRHCPHLQLHSSGPHPIPILPLLPFPRSRSGVHPQKVNCTACPSTDHLLRNLSAPVKR